MRVVDSVGIFLVGVGLVLGGWWLVRHPDAHRRFWERNHALEGSIRFSVSWAPWWIIAIGVIGIGMAIGRALA